MACTFFGREKPRAPAGTRTRDRPARSPFRTLTAVPSLPLRLENVRETKGWGSLTHDSLTLLKVEILLSFYFNVII
jgi:hypothetical protein